MKSHARFLKLGLDTNAVIATRLVNAYAASPSPNSIGCAHQLFDHIPCKDTVLWTSLISAYTRSRYPVQALRLLSQMHAEAHAKPNHFTFTIAARACGLIPDLRLAHSIHACVLKHGFRSNVVVDTSILDMYAKCHDIESSHKLFDEMPHRNTVSWNALIAGYAVNGMGRSALEQFYWMKCVQCEPPDEFSVSSTLTACAGISDLISGLQIHAYTVRSGLVSDLGTVNAVVNMYFRCGEVEHAENALKGTEENTMLKLTKIKGYAFNRRYLDVINSICHDFMETVLMDRSIVISVLTACANLSLLRIGRQVHGLILTSLRDKNYPPDDEVAIVIETALIDMYCKCYSIGEAQWVFDNLQNQQTSHWNSLIAGYIHNGLLENACQCFTKMPGRNAISWTAMISGCIQHGLPHEGLSLLQKMYSENSSAQGNCFTFATALDACSLLTALDEGKQIHAKSIRTVINADFKSVVVETALVDMYSKSGNLTYARRVFDRMGETNIISWTSMIMGYAIHGYGAHALKVFQRMLDEGFKPNEVTFIAVLSACRHCGLVEEGMHYFKLMRERYWIVPWADHYACMIDLLGRAGKLTDAWSLMEEIKDKEVVCDNVRHGDIVDSNSVLGALLGGCHLHGNVEMGRVVAGMLLERKQQISETYVALSNVYASAGMWDEAYRVRQEWRSHRVVKEPGSSQIQINHFS